MSNMIPLQAFVDKRLLPLVLTTLAALPRVQLLNLLLPLVAWILEENQAAEDDTFEHFETELHDVLTELGRFTVERRLLREAAVQPEYIEVDGELHKSVTDGTVLVHHCYGSLRVPQSRYRRVGQRGVRGSKTVPFIEAKLGLLDRSTPRLAKSQGEHAADGPSRSAIKLMRGAGLVAPSRARQDRWGRAIGHQLACNLDTVMSDARAELLPPEQTARMVASIDRFRVVMDESAPGKPPSEALKRYRMRVPYQRKPPEPFELAGRMVYAASLTLHDREGRPLGTFRYGLPHDQDPAELVKQLRKDIEWVRLSHPKAELDICLDGALDLWKVIQAGLKGIEGPPARQVVDWYHFWERTHPVLKLLYDETELTWWRHRLLRQEGAVQAMLEAMYKRVAEIHTKSVYDEVEKYQRYLEARDGLFDYASQRAQRRGLGSGSVESTCRQLGSRVRRCGQRWKEEGIGGILALRAAYDSRAAHDRTLPSMDRWTLIWNSFASSFRREIRFLDAHS